ncbi:hypothetical protein EV421DRAFT_1897954 [Armillaria borealis]|uniref:Uncharacterized protein n=1 Tax=Armillaria borealis TaxID=47425 RepID=A0AA39N1Q8_9AGAR|nr:hypothetical protein EV421DRAFT_1897954 [Armillaria borealis]
MSTASASTPALSSSDDRCKDHILHLIAMLFAELKGIAPGILLPGASLSVPAEPLPVPDEEDDPAPPTFACSTCSVLNNPGVHNPFKWYAVTCGWAVGVVQGSADQLALTTGVPGFLSSKGSTKAEAVRVFNDALSKTQIVVVPKKLRL